MELRLSLIHISRKRQQVCLTEIRTEMLSEDRRFGSGGDLTSRRLANLMNNLPGWTKERRKRRLPGYGPQWCYVRET